MSATQFRAEQIRLGSGLASSSGNLVVNLDANGGLEFNSSAVRVKLDGSSLARSSSGMRVAVDFGIATTTGDTFYYNGSAVVRLGIGSSGQVLTVAGGVPTWATPGSLATTNFVFNEVPSGTLNGTNVTFTLANTPTTGTVTLYMNGQLLHVGGSNDYTISTNTITFVTAPISTDVILANYLK